MTRWLTPRRPLTPEYPVGQFSGASYAVDVQGTAYVGVGPLLPVVEHPLDRQTAMLPGIVIMGDNKRLRVCRCRSGWFLCRGR